MRRAIGFAVAPVVTTAPIVPQVHDDGRHIRVRAPAYLNLSVAVAANTEHVLRIDGITCPFCVATSESALREIDGVASVSSDLAAGTITVCADDATAELSDDRLAALFLDKGFTYRGKETGGQCTP